MNKRDKIAIVLLYILLFLGGYFLLNLYKESRVADIIHEHAKYLDISYNQGIDRFHVIGENIYYSMQNDKEFIELLAQTTDENIDKSHEKIYKHFEKEFTRLKLSGIMGIQIISLAKKSVVRMHKPNRYGDPIVLTRPLLKEMSEKRVYLHGFEEGKTVHAYREAYPLYKDGKYIGGLEILFSSTKLQDYTMVSSNIHTHFIVNKNVFDFNNWDSEESGSYEQSIEDKDYLFSMNDHINHDTLQKSKKNLIKPHRREIEKGIEAGENFSVYSLLDESAKVITFKPVKRYVDNKCVAYIVSYDDSNQLYELFETLFILKLLLAIVLLLASIITMVLLKEKASVMNELKYDGLTQVYNRKYFIESFSQESKGFYKQGQEISFVMADIDFFKQVNDTHGHQYGDIVLQEFSKILKESIRSVDSIARYGGEEFLILLLANKENSQRIIEAIRTKIEAHQFGYKKLKITASFGIASSNGKYKFNELVGRADAALYKAKESGRNRVEVE